MPPRPASRLRHPPKRAFWWTATSPSKGPSGKGVVFPEGPVIFKGTFHARGCFSGRSCVFQGDLPCQEPFSRKVLCFSGGPSMLGAIFPEGPRTGWRTGWRTGPRTGPRTGWRKGLHCGRDGSLFDDLAWQHRQKEFDLAVWHRQKSMIRQGDVGRKFVIPGEIDYFCVVSI